MPPAGKKKGGEKVKSKGDSSDVTSDGAGRSLADGGRKVRHTESELSSTEFEEELKRFKPNSPKAKRAAVGAEITDAMDVEMAVSGVASTGDEARARPRKKAQPVADGGAIGRMKAVSTALMGVVMVDGVEASFARSVMEHAGKFETLLFGLLAENERLKGRLEAYETGRVAAQQPAVFKQPLPPAQRMARGVAASSAPVPEVVPVVMPKPVETWSVVVKGKKGGTSKEVVDKVVGEVAPKLGVRIHEVRPIRGGAVIRTPSVAERRKIADNARFSEVGLEVSVVEKLGPKLVVRGVHAEISPDDFMEDLFSLNLKEMLTRETFGRSVRLASAPWKTGDSGQVNVVLECTQSVADHLRATGVYVKWFRFQVRVQDIVPSCFRCLGYGHMVRECRVKEDVCLRCGTSGHRGSVCPNEVRCRDCAFKGWPATHRMMTAACPVYAAIAARVNARH